LIHAFFSGESTVLTGIDDMPGHKKVSINSNVLNSNKTHSLAQGNEPEINSK
jgi:hypothetical protein